MKKILLLCITCLFSPILSASKDFSPWLSNTYQTDFGGSNYLAFLELAPRTKNDNGDFAQIIIRPLLGYKLNKELSIWLGYTWQGEYTKSHADKFDNATNDVVEQIQWVHDIDPHWNFQYRFRVEQRFFADADVAHRFPKRPIIWPRKEGLFPVMNQAIG
jgi:hypothetical protein